MRYSQQTDLDEFVLANSPEQHDILQVLLGVVSAPAIGKKSACMLGMSPYEGSNGELHLGVDLYQGLVLSISKLIA